MKTTYLKTTSLAGTPVKKNSIINTLIGRKAAVVVASILIASSGFAQQSKQLTWSAGISAQVNANNFGTAYLPSFAVTKGRTTITLSPVIQKRQMNVAGAQIGGQYALTGEQVTGEAGPELFVHWQGAFLSGALMGKSALRNESTANVVNAEVPVKEMRFSSLETFAGVGLKVRLLHNLKWVNTVGLGANSCLKTPDCKNMYFSTNNFGLNLSTGFTYVIR